MSDSEKLIAAVEDDSSDVEVMPVIESKKKKKALRDRDDLSGLVLNMIAKVDCRELFILWIVFVFIHTEMFSDYVLKRFNGTTNEDKTMTMKGTMYSSAFMIIIIILCALIF